MSFKIIVLAKQVPDTRNVGKDAMKEDGTINRAALPAIFNPEDLNALEQALRLKDAYPGTTVTLLTMGWLFLGPLPSTSSRPRTARSAGCPRWPTAVSMARYSSRKAASPSTTCAPLAAPTRR